MPENRSLSVFLCHASPDKPTVRALYKRLIANGIDAWLDEERLLPGQNWREEIPQAVRSSDVVIVCISGNSVNKEGFVQKEIKEALDIAGEKPEGTIFVIPARLEACNVPNSLKMYQWVDLFEKGDFEKLVRALTMRAEQINIRATRNIRTQVSEGGKRRQSGSAKRIISIENPEGESVSIKQLIEKYVMEHFLLSEAKILDELARLLKSGNGFIKDMPKTLKKLNVLNVSSEIIVEFVIKTRMEERYKFYIAMPQNEEDMPSSDSLLLTSDKSKQESRTGYMRKYHQIRKLFYDFYALGSNFNEEHDKPSNSMDIIWESKLQESPFQEIPFSTKDLPKDDIYISRKFYEAMQDIKNN